MHIFSYICLSLKKDSFEQFEEILMNSDILKHKKSRFLKIKFFIIDYQEKRTMNYNLSVLIFVIKISSFKNY
jgi:hypothetical protein